MPSNHEPFPILLLVDRVRSHYEIGGLFRLCEAFEVQRLIICGVPVNLQSRKLVKASKGSYRRVHWTIADNAFDVVQSAKDYGLYILALNEAPGSLNVINLKPERPALLVLTSENEKPDQQVLDWADTVVSFGKGVPLCAVAALLLHQVMG